VLLRVVRVACCVLRGVACCVLRVVASACVLCDLLIFIIDVVVLVISVIVV
jgi:hypothetical protein